MVTFAVIATVLVIIVGLAVYLEYTQRRQTLRDWQEQMTRSSIRQTRIEAEQRMRRAVKLQNMRRPE